MARAILWRTQTTKQPENNMRSPSPYDLSATPSFWRKTQKKQVSNSKPQRADRLNSPDAPSPYDLLSHGGLARLAEEVRKNPRLM